VSLEAFSLEGKVALVTGAARGIGEACARTLAAAGARVMATDVDSTGAEKIAEAIRKEGFDAVAMEQDVCDEARWEQVVAATVEQLGGIDVLVNNAGIFHGSTLEEDTLEGVRRVNAVNIESIFLGMKYAVRAMKPGGAVGRGGSIINLSSVAGLVGVPGHSAYGSTKGAVRLYTKHAAVEFGALGYPIRVNSVHPGLIETAMRDLVFDDLKSIGIVEDTAGARELAESMTAVGRLGTPQEVAHAVLFLASDASSYMTGAELAVDGGFTAK